MNKEEWRKKIKEICDDYECYDYVKNKIDNAGKDYKEDKKWFEHYNKFYNPPYNIMPPNPDIKIMKEFMDWVMKEYWNEIEKPT